MKYEITVCDICNKGTPTDFPITPNDVPVNTYLIKPKMGEEGYMIDYEEIDLCGRCLEDFKKCNPKRDFFYAVSGKSI
jgi:hypothetical protein